MNSEHSIGRTCKRTAKSGSQRKVGFRRISANRLDAPTVGNGILSNLATSAHSGLTTIEAVEDGWCRRCISHAMASGSQTVRLRRARAARSAETGFAPGHGGFTAAHGSAFHPCAGTGWIADFALLM